MNRLLIATLFLLITLTGSSQTSTEKWLNELNRTIDATPGYDQQKADNIALIKRSFVERKNDDLQALFSIYLQLYEEYKVFKYDSAFSYARKLQTTAIQLSDPDRIVSARLKLSFTLLSAGMFKETLDTLKSTAIRNAPDSLKAEYYALLGRYYYDLGDFDNDPYLTPAYNDLGNHYMDSALRLFPPNSFQYTYYRGLMNIKSRNPEMARTAYRELLDKKELTLHEIAVTASTLSDIYITSREYDTAISLLIQAAIADIKSSTKETAAIFNLAQLLYKKGDVRNASSYIEVAIRDATFYGARQRKVQASAILPLIEGEKVARVESQKKSLFVYAIGTTLLLLLVLALTFVIFRQVKKLKAAQKVITEAHGKEQAANQMLVETNNKLTEANKIKEEYIGYFFNADSEYFAKIEKFKKALEQKIAYRKWDDAIALINQTNLKKEKEELLQNFDKVFLKLFPDFIQGYNALFQKEDQVQLKEQELLNTDLRIFALIRMGIHDNEKIARILEYSVNTINTYKTRIKNKSLVPNEEFEKRIMEIRAL